MSTGVDLKRVELLSEAFNTFMEASERMQAQYAALEGKVSDLKAELAEKNRVIERSRRLSAMGELSAKIAHEIRNPLASMALFASMLERDLEGEPDKQRLAIQITRGIETLDNVLSNMLVFAGRGGARLGRVRVEGVIDEALDLAKGVKKDGVEVRREYDGAHMVMGDRGLLRQAFLNIILNAYEAVGGSGVLCVSTRMVEVNDAKRVRVEFKDSGPGITADLVDRVFDPFFSTKDAGTGLGLAIVANVAEAHEAVLDVESEEGSGALFAMTLPVAVEVA